MANDHPNGDPAEQELKKLEYRINELIKTCERLKDENRILRDQQSSLLSERDALLEKNEQARIKVESMIMRLKSMEQPA
ncbi:MAG: TIGR02449 family protein [Chromatiales bacterium]|jgi:cell division protein ZapB|nr:TIGR02449 family protein [Chromatiales bacterium]MDX9766445.1 TIGR02449 family protein [Ectothiorhodospiraceae bacterium]